VKRILLAALAALATVPLCLSADASVMLDSNIVREGGIIKIKIFSDKPLKACDIEFNKGKYTAFFKQFDLKQNQYLFTAIIPVALGTGGNKKLVIKYMLSDGGEHRQEQKIYVKALKEKDVMINTGQMNDELDSELAREGKMMYSLQDAVTPVKYSFPFMKPVDAPVTGGFGDSRVYDGGRAAWRHKGLDMGAKKGTPVRADSDGVIVSASVTKAYGNIVIIDHGAGIYSMYFHMQKLYVKKNDSVSKGDIIGNVGNEGLSTGPHLHWQINVCKIPVNPAEFLKDF
jgi:murein DD-endopeptidase MepM/ murein hydrolase activator NlpD